MCNLYKKCLVKDVVCFYPSWNTWKYKYFKLRNNCFIIYFMVTPLII